MTLTDEVAVSAQALSEVRHWAERRDKDLLRCYQGVSHRQNQQAAEVEDLWKTAEEMQKALQAFAKKEHELTETVDKIAAYLKKKFPEDFGGGS